MLNKEMNLFENELNKIEAICLLLNKDLTDGP